MASKFNGVFPIEFSVSLLEIADLKHTVKLKAKKNWVPLVYCLNLLLAAPSVRRGRHSRYLRIFQLADF